MVIRVMEGATVVVVTGTLDVAVGTGVDGADFTEVEAGSGGSTVDVGMFMGGITAGVFLGVDDDSELVVVGVVMVVVDDGSLVKEVVGGVVVSVLGDVGVVDDGTLVVVGEDVDGGGTVVGVTVVGGVVSSVVEGTEVPVPSH